MISLPIDSLLPALRVALDSRDEVVLEAPPGAGKTTRVPLALLDQPWLGDRCIIMLEPRRLAARAAAERLAHELGEKVGETVGYRIRLDSKVGPCTRIEVVTEGILTRRLQEDPALEGVGLVIFDEFHERSLDADLALALSLNGRAMFRGTDSGEPALKILLMSATLEGERLSSLLDDAPVLRSEGRMFPVDIRWGAPWRTGGRIEQDVVQKTLQALAEESGSVLVFLPGQGEIRRVHELLQQQLSDDVVLCPLYGDLSLAEQRAAIEPSELGKRKVVLATNIAETSLTIDGVRVVIDSGLARVPRFDPVSGMTRLDTQRISRASATQRAGRAGRLEPGVCYRLWSQEQHEQLVAYSAAEILQADLSGLALQLARWGATPDELVWLDTPPTAAYAQARDLLQRLSALDSRYLLTEHGRHMAELPVHPRIAHLLLRGQALGLGELACSVAAVLSERDTLRGAGADLHHRLQALAGTASGASKRIRQLARQFQRLLSSQPSVVPASDPDHPRWLGCLLALAYPDRVACQRQADGAQYRLANGRAAQFTEADALMKCPWLVVADLGSHQGQQTERIYLAVELDPALFDKELSELVSEQEVLDWDEREGVLLAEWQRRVGELVLERKPVVSPDPAARVAVLLTLIRRKGLSLLPWTPELRQWQARVALLRELDVAQGRASEWPDVSDSALMQTLEDWLAPYLGNVTRLGHFASLDLAAILQGLLPWPLPQRLDEQAPQTFMVPTGSRIRLDYHERPPVLAVRLQELFGLAATPRIAGGRVALKLHLLSPARRPVQVTQDLASFWASTYADVKKDLKGRYPKHYWPDDPLIAEPTARAKPRK